MKKILFRLLISALISLPFAGTAEAQATTSLVVSIEGLNTEMRDGLMREIGTREDLRLSFACVPAGILVFEGNAATSDQLRDRLAPILEHRIARQRIRTIDASRSTVEQQCAEARNR